MLVNGVICASAAPKKMIFYSGVKGQAVGMRGHTCGGGGAPCSFCYETESGPSTNQLSMNEPHQAVASVSEQALNPSELLVGGQQDLDAVFAAYLHLL